MSSSHHLLTEPTLVNKLTGGLHYRPAVLTYATNNTPNASKRGVTSAMIITAGAVGGVVGGTIFRSQDAPLYFPGMWYVD
jgi:hypothetical protein